MAIFPVLDQLNLIDDDMDRSVDFYRAIGLHTNMSTQQGIVLMSSTIS